MGPLTVEDSVLFSADDAFLSSDLLVLLLLLDSSSVAFKCSFACEVFGLFCSVAATSDVCLLTYSHCNVPALSDFQMNQMVLHQCHYQHYLERLMSK